MSCRFARHWWCWPSFEVGFSYLELLLRRKFHCVLLLQSFQFLTIAVFRLHMGIIDESFRDVLPRRFTFIFAKLSLNVDNILKWMLMIDWLMLYQIIKSKFRYWPGDVQGKNWKFRCKFPSATHSSIMPIYSQTGCGKSGFYNTISSN